MAHNDWVVLTIHAAHGGAVDNAAAERGSAEACRNGQEKGTPLRKTRAGIGLLACALSAAAALPCNAQQSLPAYPDKPIRLIVPSPPGGGNDIMARLAAQRISDAWG